MKRLFTFFIVLILTIAVITCAYADEWICPNCGRKNDGDMNFCGNCRTEKPIQSYNDLSPMGNAWVCSSCSRICPEADNYCTNCSTEHFITDPSAVLIDKPVFEEVYVQPASVQRISCSYNHGSSTINYTANLDGNYRFWVEDQSSDFSGRILLHDNSGKLLRSNDFFSNNPALTYRLSAKKTYSLSVEGDYRITPNFTLCIGEPQKPLQINARNIIQDSMDYYDQENTYLFVPQITGEYRVDVTEMQMGQEIDLKVQDELGYTIKSSSFGISMGNGISFKLDTGKPYYIIAGQRTGFNSTNLGGYKLQLSSPNPTVSITGCNAIGDSLYYQHQKNIYEFVASETGTYVFQLITYASCEYSVSLLDELGYTINSSGYSSDCHADLVAGKSYQIIVEQHSGIGGYSLFIKMQ